MQKLLLNTFRRRESEHQIKNLKIYEKRKNEKKGENSNFTWIS